MFSNSKSKPSHQRSQSTPYFQHTRGFTDFKDFESGLESRISASPPSFENSLSKVSSFTPNTTTRRRGHARTLTATSPPQRPPLVTTHIQVESHPAVPPPVTLSSSVFSNSSSIKFDLSPPGSPSLSPAKDKERWSAFLPSLKPAKSTSSEERPTRSPSPTRLAAWFQGESAPVNISVLPSPSKELPDPMQACLPSPSSSPTRRKSVTPSLKAQLKPTPGSSLFSFFTASRTSPTSTSVPTHPRHALSADILQNDEFASLDIKKSLYPSPNSTDPFSPSSFKNIQQNAEGLLARMQAAYKTQLLSLKSVLAEQEAQGEELEEAQTRAQHLKNQLDAVSGQLVLRESETDRLGEELEEEKRLRKEAERATIRVVGEPTATANAEEEEGVNPSPTTTMRGSRHVRARTSLGSTASTPSMVSDEGSEGSVTLIEERPRTPGSFWDGKSGVLREKRSGGGLAEENAALRARVGHLEKELDGCLDLLRGMGLS